MKTLIDRFWSAYAKKKQDLLIESYMVPPFLPDETEKLRIMTCLRPERLLIEFRNRSRFGGPTKREDGRLVYEIELDRTYGHTSPAELARLNAHKPQRKRWLEADNYYLAAAKRLNAIGVALEFSGQGDYCGDYAVLRITTSELSLPKLQNLAADDAGIKGEKDRVKAAEKFRIYMCCNFDEDHKANQKKYGECKVSPYQT